MLLSSFPFGIKLGVRPEAIYPEPRLAPPSISRCVTWRTFLLLKQSFLYRACGGSCLFLWEIRAPVKLLRCSIPFEHKFLSWPCQPLLRGIYRGVRYYPFLIRASTPGSCHFPKVWIMILPRCFGRWNLTITTLRLSGRTSSNDAEVGFIDPLMSFLKISLPSVERSWKNFFLKDFIL